MNLNHVDCQVTSMLIETTDRNWTLNLITIYARIDFFLAHRPSCEGQFSFEIIIWNVHEAG